MLIRIPQFVKAVSIAVAVTVLASVALDPAWAQCDMDEFKVTASDGGNSNQFGYAVAIEGDVAVAGAWLADPNGTDSGEAYVYRFTGSGWTEEATLMASDGAPYDLFGSAVAVSGNVIVIGASENDSAGYNSNAGAVYVYRKVGSNWIEEAKLLPDDGQPNDRFGTAVAVSGNLALIGASGDDDGGSNSGSAYVFAFGGSSWQQNDKLLAADGGGFDHFGNSVGLSGDRAVIGAHLHFNDEGLRSGAAYVFRVSGSSWIHEATLEAADAATYDYFGYSVAIDGNVIAVGAYQDDDNGSDSGAAYVFRRSGTSWSQEDKVTSSDGVPNDYLGHAVAVSGEQLVAGAYSNGWPGAAYLFGNSAGNWTQTAKLTPSDWGMNDYFGAAVGLSNGVAIVGSYHDDDLGLSSGSAYLYSGDCNSGGCASDADCDDDDACTADACNSGDCSNVPMNCNDGNACTADSCVNGDCVNDMICECQSNNDCDDDDACTADSCLNNNCVNQTISCNDGNACTEDSCNSSSGCSNEPLDCDDGDNCTADSCDGGACVNDFVCECQANADCNDGNACTEDRCLNNSCVNDFICECINDAGCDDGDNCTADSCVQGSCAHEFTCECMNDADCDDDSACTEDRCLNNSCVNDFICECINDAACDDGDDCTADSCVSGSCTHEFTCECMNDAGCDDANACTADTCVSGSCTHEFTCECMNDAGCYDGDDCTADSCVSGSCTHEFTCECMNDAGCDDGDNCTADSCVQGTCAYEFTCECMNDAGCDDGDNCTADSCVQGSCAHEFTCECMNDADCDDDDACTADDCAAGSCVHEDISCSDSNDCTIDSCDPQSGCSHELMDCDDDNDCTADTCTAGECVNVMICECVSNSDCDDGNSCTEDRCRSNACVSEPIICDDGDDCTADICVSGSCVFEMTCECVANSDCDDGDGCTEDVCIDNSCSNEEVDCNDNNSCTADSCANGECIHDMICECVTDADCDDGSDCTADSCLEHSCVHNALPCDDGDPCTTDICDPQGGCSSTPLDCDDDDACTVDFCEGGVCKHENSCECSSHDDCDDGDACTKDRCNDAQCFNFQIDCDDEDPCTVTFCDPASGCGSEPIDCDDGDDCTLDSCDDGECVHIEDCVCDRDADCDDGRFCNGEEACKAGACVPGKLPCSGPCNEVTETCGNPTGTAKAEVTVITIGESPVTVQMANSYDSPVVVCSIHYANNSLPVVTRVSNVASDSFDVRLQNPSGQTVAAEQVTCMIVEQGVWNIDGVALEAQAYESRVTDQDNSWTGEVRNYWQEYDHPVVLGQVMSENDPRWSVFWCQGSGARVNPPSVGALRTGKTVGEDDILHRENETIGFIVIEAGHGTLGGVEFEARVGPDIVRGIADSPSYAYDFTASFETPPTLAIVTMAGVDGGNGGWAYTHGPTMATASGIFLAVDEDQLLDDERHHTNEQIGYIAFEGPLVISD